MKGLFHHSPDVDPVDGKFVMNMYSRGFLNHTFAHISFLGGYKSCVLGISISRSHKHVIPYSSDECTPNDLSTKAMLYLFDV